MTELWLVVSTFCHVVCPGCLMSNPPQNIIACHQRIVSISTTQPVEKEGEKVYKVFKESTDFEGRKFFCKKWGHVWVQNKLAGCGYESGPGEFTINGQRCKICGQCRKRILVERTEMEWEP